MQVQQNIPALHVTNRDYEATKQSLIEEYSQPKPALFVKMVLRWRDKIHDAETISQGHHSYWQ